MKKDQKVPEENIKQSLDSQIKKRMQFSIDPEKIWQTIKQKAVISAFQTEVREKLILNHKANSRNQFDVGEIFVKISKIYERYYQKLRNKVSKL